MSLRRAKRFEAAAGQWPAIDNVSSFRRQDHVRGHFRLETGASSIHCSPKKEEGICLREETRDGLMKRETGMKKGNQEEAERRRLVHYRPAPSKNKKEGKREKIWLLGFLMTTLLPVC